jgi:hypothetical protein
VDYSKEQLESDKAVKKIETDHAVKPSVNLDLWVGLCSTVGFLSYTVFDVMVLASLFRYFFEKHVLRTTPHP